MKWIQVKVIYTSDQLEMAAELIFAQMYLAGLTGLVEVEPGRDETQDWAKEAPMGENQYAVTGYFPAMDTTEKVLEELKRDLKELEAKGQFRFEIEKTLVDEENWAESWKEFFYPQRVGKHFIIKPTWREYDLKKEDVLIEIDPGMAFGTGSHATTSLCLEVLEEMDVAGKTVLDVGTGSGILLVGAARLGAKYLMGTDFDPVAIQVAQENLQLNGIQPDRYELKTGDLVTVVKDTYDIVVANILTDVILRMLPDIHSVVKENSMLLVSGIIEENEKIIFDKMSEVGFSQIRTRKKDGWVVLWGKYSA